MNKQMVQDIYDAIDEILEKCDEDFDFMAGNPDNTFGALMGAHAILGQLLSERGNR
ncbi:MULTISPECIES: hypothetical protein [unclassified Streptococcus]|uniref:hypothetical protein n=1 Tax=unclassified Streptococcus TaxID=2608887 RepID=UPI00211ACE0A|nr:MULTISPECIES: hypothetical protein [unclassified Streptococcus]MCQ9211637.1 hypothetical protein [Streptococcus sp. B01]MCQ9213154.1 hypothetical protein [Streptococcus sp. O1]MCQ9214942.1 hypothetical protein [Streptococcus sp. O1]MCQ9215076.1 hypothetical protein [Streptococcus sp. O1]